MGFFSWLLHWNTPTIEPAAVTVVPVSAKKQKRRRKVRLRQTRPKIDAEDAADEILTAMIEKQIEQDENDAADQESQSGPQDGAPGYVVLALQEQMMELQKQIAMMQAGAVEVSSQSAEESPEKQMMMGTPPPPVPPRDDSPFVELPMAPPPPPTPSATPLSRRPSLRENTFEAPVATRAPLSEQICDKTRSVLKTTNIPRSPGGTPMNRRPASHASPGSLHAALTKKFASVRMPDSPAVNESMDEWEEDEQENGIAQTLEL